MSARMEKVRERIEAGRTAQGMMVLDVGGSIDPRWDAALAEVEEWEAMLADAHRGAARVEAERDRYAAALRESNTGHYRPVKP